MEINLKIHSENAQVIAFCQEYWNWDAENKVFVGTATGIAAKYNVASSYELLKLISQNCAAESTHLFCERCKKPYEFRSRSDFKDRLAYLDRNWTCPSCLKNIEEERKRRELETERAKIQLVVTHFSLENRLSISVDDLSLHQAVYLLTTIRALSSEDYSILYPLATSQNKLAPSLDYSIKILKKLYHDDLLYVHPKSPVNAFTFEGDNITSLWLDKTAWALPLMAGSSKEVTLVNAIEQKFHAMDWSEDWHNEQLTLWKDIALAECLEYLGVCLAEHTLPFNVLQRLIEDFSVAQIYNFIWAATRDAAAFLVRTNSTKQHAANTVVGTLQRSGERAKASGWDVKPYGRSFKCSQSILSQVYFNLVLQIGDDGFNKVPFEI